MNADQKNAVTVIYPRARLTTAAEYFDACSGASNVAGTLIDEGFEPFVITSEELAMGLHPFVPVFDISTKKTEDGYFIATVPAGDLLLTPDTLIAWK